jgi:class 3 adenylate cyclase
MRAKATAGASSPAAPGGFIGVRSPVYVTKSLFERLQEWLRQEDNPIRRLSTHAIWRCFVYIDNSDFSKYLPGQEVLIINSIVRIVKDAKLWNSPRSKEARAALEAMMCIGDGYIFVLNHPIDATYFAAHLAQLVETLVARDATPVEFHFRMGVHFGPVYCFWDPGRNDWNYIGEGINGGQRVLGAIGKETDDVLFMSGQVRQALTSQDQGSSPIAEILSCLQNRGRKADKHGNLWRVYEVNHTQLTSMGLPQYVYTVENL